MCLIKTHRFPKRAKEDIVVYKELYTIGEYVYMTPYQHTLVKLNSYIYNSLPIWFGIFNSHKIAGEGVHSYIYPSKGLFKAIIPKGSWYYIGLLIGDYASNKLYVTNEQVCSVLNGKVITRKIPV